MKLSKSIFFILVIVVVFYACKHSSNREVFYYKRFNKENRITSYIKKITYRYTDSIIDTTFYYGTNKKLKNSELNKTIFLSNGIKKNGVLYSFLKDTCFISITNYDDEVEVCNLDEHTIKINNKDFRANKYRLDYFKVDGISLYEYYDNNYILFKKEYNEGYAPYFREQRSDVIEGL